MELKCVLRSPEVPPPPVLVVEETPAPPKPFPIEKVIRLSSAVLAALVLVGVLISGFMLAAWFRTRLHLYKLRQVPLPLFDLYCCLYVPSCELTLAFPCALPPLTIASDHIECPAYPCMRTFLSPSRPLALSPSGSCLLHVAHTPLPLRSLAAGFDLQISAVARQDQG